MFDGREMLPADAPLCKRLLAEARHCIGLLYASFRCCRSSANGRALEGSASKRSHHRYGAWNPNVMLAHRRSPALDHRRRRWRNLFSLGISESASGTLPAQADPRPEGPAVVNQRSRTTPRQRCYRAWVTRHHSARFRGFRHELRRPDPLRCPNCDHSFQVKPAAAGRKVRCPQCKEPVAVPAGSDDEARPAATGRGDDSPPPLPAGAVVADQPAFEPVGDPPSRREPARAAVAARVYSLPPSRSCPVIVVIRWTFGILGAFVSAVGLGGLTLSVISLFNSDSLATFKVAPASLDVLVSGLLLIAFSELLKMAIDIQANTLAAAQASEYTASQASSGRTDASQP